MKYKDVPFFKGTAPVTVFVSATFFQTVYESVIKSLI